MAASKPNTTRVRCDDCGWQGTRVYRPLDDLSGKPSGFGHCAKCGKATLYKVPRTIRHIDR